MNLLLLSSSSLLLAVTFFLPSLPPPVSAAVVLGSAAHFNDCRQGEEQLDFTFFMDEDSDTENGWTLTCEGDEGIIWDVPVGSLPSITSSTNNSPVFVQEQACLPANFTCYFQLKDSRGDGLLFPGYYYLTHGATTIAVAQEGEEFLEKNYCFGPNCSGNSGTIKEVDDEQCDYVNLFFQTDEHPEESSVTIECRSDTSTPLFSKSDFSDPFQVVAFEHCLPIEECCSLTVSDSAGNAGIFSGGGHIFVEWANQIIFNYQGDSTIGSTAFRFGTISLEFGLGCANFDPNNPDGTAPAFFFTEETIVKNGMSSTAQLVLVVLASLVVVGGAMLMSARFCYPTTTLPAIAQSDDQIRKWSR